MRMLPAIFVLAVAPAALAQTPTVTSTSPYATQPAPMQMQMMAPQGQMAQPQQPPPAAPMGGGGMGLSKVFDEADTNHDNVVTREEFTALANKHFGMADTNKDGKITRDEMQAQQANVMQQMQKNLLGNVNIQTRLNQFMGGGAAAPVPVTTTGPTTPYVRPPTPPTAPRSY